jgi:hypothetical protein
VTAIGTQYLVAEAHGAGAIWRPKQAGDESPGGAGGNGGLVLAHSPLDNLDGVNGGEIGSIVRATLAEGTSW